MTSATELPVPSFFQPKNAEVFAYRPDQQRLFEAAAAWRKAHAIAPAREDARKIHLVLIDVQKDFCFPEGSLYVRGRSGRGALDDNRRTAEFIYRNLGALTQVTATMDTHYAFQIFFPSFWIDANGGPLTPFREITTADIDRGDVRPNPAVAAWLCNGDYSWLEKQVRFYCAELETGARYRLYLWPPHCILGSDGHALVGVVHEARMFHSFVRGVQSSVEVKGGNALTENYSVLRPEVLIRHDGQALAERNSAFLRTLLAADAVVIAGQAASHCVKSSIDDLAEAILAENAALARKVYILEDCMSSGTVPDGAGGFAADFTPETEKAFERYRAAGMHLVRSTDPIASWPGVPRG